jgi:hypothetical protein
MGTMMNADTLLVELMTGGGDARIRLDSETGLNRYFSAPRPSGVLAYASSTANDISAAAFAHVRAKLTEIVPAGELSAEDYVRHLEQMRMRIRHAYGVPEDVAIVFAPSGTDLEYVALACTGAEGGTHNILLGAEEVGSGDIDRLRAEHRATFVVDACQARITSPAIAEYLAREAIVFVTGSKFMGGPPFSGFALVPRALARRARPLPEGLNTIFQRAEWPAGWPGTEQLPDTTNLGLLLRLEASIFELERFQQLSLEEVSRVILSFHQAVRDEIVDKTPARRVAPYPPGRKETADNHPVEMRTLSTLDLTGFGGGASFEDAGRWHKAMLAHGVRLGQPVKCVKLPDGQWGATLRIGLSMPQVVERATLDDEVLRRSFASDMERIRTALEAVAA